MTYVITQGCADVLDKSCLEVCPADCLYEGNRMMYINPAECIDCGACEPVCPQQAIYHEELLPADLLPFLDANAQFIARNGLEGGGVAVGKTDDDADISAALPAVSG
jgi:NAD-dependent dihydropyrimidine dehydrogenase PreA subunit